MDRSRIPYEDSTRSDSEDARVGPRIDFVGDDAKALSR